MRLLIIGTLGGQLTTATKLAMEKGANVTHADSNDQALAVLRSGRGADLLMVDVALDIRDLVARLDAERIHVPIVACGVTNDARAAVNAIHEGADAAGHVIEAFSNFVMSGNFVIGIIVFAILVIVNFVVITKGSGRIAEVAARFHLDAMPGKQMAIDADLSAGLIDEKEARRRRQTL